MLVKPGGPDIDGAHDAWIYRIHLLLHFGHKSQILSPMVVGQAAGVGARHQHQLSGLTAVDLGHGLIFFPTGCHHGVPVDVDHKLDGGVLFHCLGNNLQRPVISAVIGRAVVEHGGMNRLNPLFIEDFFDLSAHPHHIVIGVRGSVGVRGLIPVGGVRRISLAAVGVDNQHRRLLGGNGDFRFLIEQSWDIDRIIGFVFDINGAGTVVGAAGAVDADGGDIGCGGRSALGQGGFADVGGGLGLGGFFQRAR